MRYPIAFTWEIQLEKLVIDSSTYFFVVNADSRIGGGHLKRCVNIAQELSTSVSAKNIRFIHWSLDEGFTHLIEPFQSCSVRKNDLLLFLQEFASQQSASPVVIIDSDDQDLHGVAFQNGLAQTGVRSVYFTVNASNPYRCDVLINPSILALHQTYQTADHTKYLFGPEYMIFGESFRKLKIQPIRRFSNSLFINFGSADPMRYTLKVLKALARSDSDQQFILKVVVGGLSSGWDEVHSYAKSSSQHIDLYHDITNVREVMNQCQLAICSPGTTFWELAVLGIRSIVLSSSQREVETTNLLDKLGYARLLLHCNQDFDDDCVTKLNKFLQDHRSIGENFEDLQERINPNGLNKIVQELQQIRTI